MPDSEESIQKRLVRGQPRLLVAALFLPVTASIRPTPLTCAPSTAPPSARPSSASTTPRIQTPPAPLFGRAKVADAAAESATSFFPERHGRARSVSETGRAFQELMADADANSKDELVEWTIEPSSFANIGLQNAINSVYPDGRPERRIGIGLLAPRVDAVSRFRDEIDATLCLRHDCRPVWLPDAVLEGAYDGFCKQVLWKLFHYRLLDVESMARSDAHGTAWDAYVAMNAAFADCIAAEWRDGDIVWINDYHLCLVPQMLRKRIPTATCGFFLHIPFPSSELFRVLPHRRQILEGLLGADMIGFQSYCA